MRLGRYDGNWSVLLVACACSYALLADVPASGQILIPEPTVGPRIVPIDRVAYDAPAAPPAVRYGNAAPQAGRQPSYVRPSTRSRYSRSAPRYRTAQAPSSRLRPRTLEEVPPAAPLGRSAAPTPGGRQMMPADNMPGEPIYSDEMVPDGGYVEHGDGYPGDAYGGEYETYGSGMHGYDMHSGDIYGDEMMGDECCDSCCDDPCWDACDVLLENLSIFGGVHGFKSPTDRFGESGVLGPRNNNGNFGFQEGINWGVPIFGRSGIGYQLGGQVVQSDISGDAVFDDARTQFFVTTGLFYRPPCGSGLQGGAAIDFLHDEYFVDMDLTQIRAEVSYVGKLGNEIGFWGAFGAEEDDSLLRTTFGDTILFTESIQWDVVDMYTLFYRRHFCNGSTAKVWGGFTGDGDGLLGAEVSAPLAERFAVQAGFNYLIPDTDSSTNEAFREVWGLSINLVWYPGYRRCCSPSNPYRPLFNVADNNTMLVDQASHPQFTNGFFDAL